MDPEWGQAAFCLALERFGYDITDGHKAVEAFQRRWRPHRINGEIDGEIRAILFQLLLESLCNLSTNRLARYSPAKVTGNR